MRKIKRVEGKRWGPTFVDSRDWPTYNEELVVRGEFLLDTEWVASWHEELDRMNEGKRGRPFEFPESLIELQAILTQWLGVRQVEGVTRKLAECGKLPDFDSYSTVSRRVGKIDTSLELPKHGFVSVACDGSGFKMNQAGEYRYDRYGRKKMKKWIRVVISANPLTGDLLDLEVHVDGEGPSEPQVAMMHLKNLSNFGIEVDKFWGDGAFDVKELFNLLEQLKAESAIPFPGNASTTADGSMRRAREVIDYKIKGYRAWAREKQYGKRWLATEGEFSAVKRIFGERTRAKTEETMCHELKRRFWAYEVMRKYAKE